MVNSLTLSVMTIVFYIGAAVTRLYLKPSHLFSAKQLLLLLGIVAISLHGILLYSQIFIGAGINFGFFNAASLVAWGIALLLWVTVLAKPVENLLIALFPLAALFSSSD